MALGLFARSAPTDQVANALSSPLVKNLVKPILDLPEREQIIVLVLGYLLSPLLLVIPLMVSAVLAADAFAGEKERRTLEGLLYLPISDRDLFLAKVLGAFVPALAITWVGAFVYALLVNIIGWPVMHRVFVPFTQWLLVMGWVAPAVALLSLGLLVIVSSRARTTQEANQLGGAVILPADLPDRRSGVGADAGPAAGRGRRRLHRVGPGPAAAHDQRPPLHPRPPRHLELTSAAPARVSGRGRTAAARPRP